MTTLKSLEDLKKIRDEALAKKQAKATSGTVQITVGMGTCGIAAGAREAMKSILAVIEQDNLSSVLVTQTGCIGICEKEPIVQVTIGSQETVSYGKVTAEVAARIMKEHVESSRPVVDHIIELPA